MSNVSAKGSARRQAGVHGVRRSLIVVSVRTIAVH